MVHHKRDIALFGILSGIYLALAFVNPYDKELFLEEMVLQLSGSRGKLAMGCSLTELVGYMLRMAPNYALWMILGIKMYAYFCTASIYVFSRCTNRFMWYGKTLLVLFEKICIYEAVLSGTVIVISRFRFGMNFHKVGLEILGYHLMLYVFWNLFWIVFMNLLCIRLGSSAAVAFVMGFQAVCAAGLNIAGFLENKGVPDTVVEKLFYFNPVAHTILGWQYGEEKYALNLNASVWFLLICCAAVILAGGIRIRSADFIMENPEVETM